MKINIGSMRLFWIAILNLVLAQSVYGVTSAQLALRGDCCETICHEMPACGEMLMCQACTSPATSPNQRAAFSFGRSVSLVSPNHELVSTDPVYAIWTPPD